MNIADFPRYETYKDSGVEWLGDIPKSWDQSRLKLLVSIKTGEKDTVHRVDNGKYPFFIRSPKVQKIDTYSFEGEAILTAGDGDIGKIFHYINGRFDYHQRVYKFSDFKKVEGKYLYYYLQYNLAEEVVKLSAKTTVDSLRLPYLQNFVVAIPGSEEQKRIYRFLDNKTSQIDEAIAIKERQIALLKERKQIIIQKAVTQGLDPNVPMKDSGVDWIGEIPAHWEVVKLKLLANKIVDGAHFTPTYVDKGVPFLRVTDLTKMTSGGINWDEVRYIPEKEHKELIKRAKADKGDVLLSKNGTIGLTAVIDWDVEFSFFVSLCLIKLKAALSPNYFASYFNSPIVDRQITFGSSRTSVTNLHLEKIKELLIILPPIDEQDEIGSYIHDIAGEYDPAVDLQQQQIEKLKEYKTTLINSAVTGKIRITPDMVEA